jgi:hypothetical protein
MPLESVAGVCDPGVSSGRPACTPSTLQYSCGEWFIILRHHWARQHGKELEMGKGNNSQKNDKKNKKPKADAKKPANKGSNAK